MKVYRIKKNAEFRIVYKRGRSFSNNLLVLYTYRNKKGVNRLGISISKRVGKSVERNRIKRLIKEICRLNIENIKTGYDLVFIARNLSNGKSYAEIDNSIKNLIKKAGLYNK
ncbi:ribonuclease P protein component [Clostridium luticellarii]|uniref:Ribonuclease P protein component n=1 Tax=Clostridium luticellarii TaxID=1691940 RepID=A0A2T0B783_9CLOT|nr:ribonuclease P protein component [Clostridium luticellarii]MCI1945847.1 ribonuclease P protein component [Clostridium luticellarii]MCI1969179.1 ribonuclease P protein component [Clostridium luticellarii]MCI1996177.1 ribonuclease P protein component [Clostridium luticellarii]MCI2040490.1 ribonuclease P protein component [Clostridium luticellarii]PRR79732.1 Ribonuclease P protein component [Clostridium luticellarii]